MAWYLVTEGDLGIRHNLKTEPAVATLQALRRLDPGTTVFCRDRKGTKDPNIHNIWPFGRHIPRLTQFAHQSLGLPNLYLDRMMRRKLGKDCELLYALPRTRFTETIRKAKARGIPTVAHEGVIHPWFKGQRPRDGTQHPPGIDRLDYVVTLSEYAWESYVQMGFPEDRVYYAPLGVDTQKYQPQDKRDDVFRVIAIGDNHFKKGFDLLLEAWKKLALPDAELIIIGKTQQDGGRMKSLASQINNVQLLSHRDPAPYYQKADLLVHPARWEPFGKIVTEAMASGLPVIISEQTGAKDLITEGKEGFIVPEEDTDAITERIQELYNNPGERRRMGQYARKLVEGNYTWEHFSERIYKILLDICEREGITPPKEAGT